MEELKELIDLFNSGMDMTASAISIAAYILQALAIFAIAKRRCIKKPWMAWVPVVNVWIIGSIADQYRYVTKREIKNNRKILLGLNIATAVLCAVLAVMIAAFAVRLVIAAGGSLEGLIRAAENGNFDYFLPYFEDVGTSLVLLLCMLLPFSACATVYAVFYFITLYDVFKSCMPNRAKMFLLFSIFGNFAVSGIEAVFLMICREKDLGMPPRKTEVVPVAVLPPEAAAPVKEPAPEPEETEAATEE